MLLPQGIMGTWAEGCILCICNMWVLLRRRSLGNWKRARREPFRAKIEVVKEAVGRVGGWGGCIVLLSASRSGSFKSTLDRNNHNKGDSASGSDFSILDRHFILDVVCVFFLSFFLELCVFFRVLPPPLLWWFGRHVDAPLWTESLKEPNSPQTLCLKSPTVAAAAFKAAGRDTYLISIDRRVTETEMEGNRFWGRVSPKANRERKEKEKKR